MQLPSHIWRLVGSKPGPRALVLGGTHGDELTGIEVVRMLADAFGVRAQSFGTHEHTLVSGELLFGFGNPVAILKCKRSASNGLDLNRSFSERELSAAPTPSDRADLIRARELAPLFCECEIILDVHSTSSDSPPFVAFTTAGSDKYFELASRLPVRYVIFDPDQLLAIDEGIAESATVDGYAARHGAIGIGYETGREDRVEDAARVFTSIIYFLADAGCIEISSAQNICKEPRPQLMPQERFRFTHNVLAKEQEFLFDQKFQSGWQPVEVSERVGIYASGTIEYAPASGMLIFPKAAHKVAAKENLYYIAVVA